MFGAQRQLGVNKPTWAVGGESDASGFKAFHSTADHHRRLHLSVVK
jgi:hypothetical protein